MSKKETWEQRASSCDRRKGGAGEGALPALLAALEASPQIRLQALELPALAAAGAAAVAQARQGPARARRRCAKRAVTVKGTHRMRSCAPWAPWRGERAEGAEAPSADL